MSRAQYAWPIAATTGAVAAAVVSGWFARDARDYSREQFDQATRSFSRLLKVVLDAGDPQRDAQPQPSKPQLRLIQGGRS